MKTFRLGRVLLSSLLLLSAAFLTAQEISVSKAPAEGQVIDLTPKIQQSFLAGKTPPRNQWKEGKYSENSHPEKIAVEWQPVGEGAVYTLLLSESSDLQNARKIDCGKQTSAGIENLKIDTVYYWRVEGDLNGKKYSSAIRSFRTLDRPPRWLRVPGTTNVRDCGGWRVASGGKVRQGMIFRGAQLNSMKKPSWKLLPEGLQVFRELGIRSDVDLRGDKTFRSLPSPLIEIGAKPVSFGIGSYSRFLKSQKKLNEACFRYFLDPAHYPIYIHCAGGADRTGTFIMLILGTLGVSDEDLLKEYELTTYSTIGTRDRTKDKFKQYLTDLDAFAPGKTLAEKAEAYWLSRGITPEEIARFRQIMLEEKK